MTPTDRYTCERHYCGASVSADYSRCYRFIDVIVCVRALTEGKIYIKYEILQRIIGSYYWKNDLINVGKFHTMSLLSRANLIENLYSCMFIDEYDSSGIVYTFIVQILANTKIITSNKGCHRRFVDDPEVTFDGNWNFLRFFCDAKRRGPGCALRCEREGQRCLLELNSYDTLKGQLFGLRDLGSCNPPRSQPAPFPRKLFKSLLSLPARVY